MSWEYNCLQLGGFQISKLVICKKKFQTDDLQKKIQEMQITCKFSEANVSNSSTKSLNNRTTEYYVDRKHNNMADLHKPTKEEVQSEDGPKWW